MVSVPPYSGAVTISPVVGSVTISFSISGAAAGWSLSPLANVTVATSAHASANTSVRRAIPVLLPLSGAPVCAPWFFCRRLRLFRVGMGVGAGVGAALRSGWRRAGRRAGAWCVGVGLLAAKLKNAGGAVVVGAQLPELLVSRSTSRGLDWFGLVWTLADGSAREVSLHIIRISPKPDVGTVSHPWLAVNRAPEVPAILGDQVVVAIGCTGCVAANRWECWDVSSRITATHEGASCETI